MHLQNKSFNLARERNRNLKSDSYPWHVLLSYVRVVVESARVEPLSLSEVFLMLAGQNCGDAAAD